MVGTNNVEETLPILIDDDDDCEVPGGNSVAGYAANLNQHLLASDASADLDSFAEKVRKVHNYSVYIHSNNSLMMSDVLLCFECKHTIKGYILRFTESLSLVLRNLKGSL